MGSAASSEGSTTPDQGSSQHSPDFADFQPKVLLALRLKHPPQALAGLVDLLDFLRKEGTPLERDLIELAAMLLPVVRISSKREP